jgi:2-polyprenyl-6-methoxyphenol hydroxylase-like FAD-dependent oxidoreductase
MPGEIVVRGDGIAALCCARLLSRAGFQVTLEGPARPKVPAVLLSEGTQKLLQDVFDRSDLFEGATRVNQRIVAWGKDAKPTALPHSAVVLSEQALLNHIRQVEVPEPKVSEQTGWSIFAAPPLGNGVNERHFGSRVANTASAKLKTDSPTDACWIESIDDGWLFLLPAGEGAWLLSVGNTVESLLERSRLIVDHLHEVHPIHGGFASHPRIADSLCEPGWLACGTAALGFDPLCGDGAGNAIREAILACAAVRAVVGGADVDSVLAHYSSRLIAGFHRHLKLCEEYYGSGGQGLWWEEQLAATIQGIKWCQSLRFDAPKMRYRLNGFSLEALG